MSLTPLGSKLLSSTRNAMRIIDDAMEPDSESLRIGTTSSLLRDLAGPVGLELGAVFRDAPIDDPVGALLRGEVDVVLAEEPFAADEVHCEEVGTVSFGVYASERSSEQSVSSDVPLEAMLHACLVHGARVALPDVVAARWAERVKLTRLGAAERLIRVHAARRVLAPHQTVSARLQSFLDRLTRALT
jgi:hypothetical protein